MSIELLPTEQKVESKNNKSSSESKATVTAVNEIKKDAPSLFDSLMDDVKKDSTDLSSKEEKKDLKIQNNVEQKTDTKLNTNKSESSDKTPINKMVENLVNIVTVEAKEKTKIDKTETIKEAVSDIKIKVKDIIEDKVIKKDKIDKPIEELKSIVEQKTETIKEAVSEIKIKVKDIVEEKVIKKDKIDKPIEELKSIVEQKTETIKEAVS
ncbi:MAG: hypothetical protein U9N59_00790, partial [Campylobacterota bacterium]|nr:hypothetical protein [Campylobacterota bacterium]